MNSCFLAGGMFARERVLGVLVGLVAGVVDSELGVGSLGDAPEVGFVAVSCRGRFGSGVGVVGSVCRLRPEIMGLAITK